MDDIGLPPGDGELVTGMSVGPYRVLERMDASAMEVVYSAYDPKLRRKVALKLLRGGATPSDRRAVSDRLTREAQAMARLAHPNVLAVHNVGRAGDELYVAMELVEGRTLSAWVADAPRSVREVLAAFLEAGAGLAAAHDAGLIHCGFTLDSVLVGRDGRVRITDFGLARWVVSAPPETASPATGPIASPGEPQASDTVVPTGTAFYMAPELHRGLPPDAATDQFSFCVALYFALTGEYPFGSDYLVRLSSGRGRLLPEGHRRIPPWLQRPLFRGLSVDPADRFSSMSELLAALSRDPRPRLRRGLAVGAALVALIAGLGYAARRPSILCTGSDRNLAGIWDPDRRLAIERSFLATGQPYAEAAVREVGRALDTYARGWVDMRTEACEATRMRQEQPEELLGLRMVCLDTRLRELRELTARLASADASTVEQATAAAHALSDLATCADARALSSSMPPPADPQTRARVSGLRGQLAEVKAAYDLGRAVEIRPRARALVEQTRALQYRPVEAEALLQLGLVEFEASDAKAAERTLKQAVWAAEASKHDAVTVRGWTVLISVKGIRLAAYKDAFEFQRRVTAVLERMGGNDQLEGELHLEMAKVYSGLSRPAEARAEADRGLELLERRFGPSDVRVAAAVHASGRIAFFLEEDSPRALALAQRALAVRRAIYGDEHPELIASFELISIVLDHMNRRDEAITMAERGVALADRIYGRDDPHSANGLNNLALMYRRVGQYDRSLAAGRRAVHIAIEGAGRDAPTYAIYLMTVGRTLTWANRNQEALSVLREALAIIERKIGPRQMRLIHCRADIAQALHQMGRNAEAREEAVKSIELSEEIYGDESSGPVMTWKLLGEIDLDLGTSKRALAALERAHALAPVDPDLEPGERGEIDFALARAIIAAHGSRRRAASLADSARAKLANAPLHRKSRAALERWTRAHRLR
jgi:eukaryotic-like serine/threonine-protein kinase